MKGIVMSRNVTKKRVVVFYKTQYGNEVAVTAGFAKACDFDEDVCNRIVRCRIAEIDAEGEHEDM